MSIYGILKLGPYAAYGSAWATIIGLTIYEHFAARKKWKKVEDECEFWKKTVDNSKDILPGEEELTQMFEETKKKFLEKLDGKQSENLKRLGGQYTKRKTEGRTKSIVDFFNEREIKEKSYTITEQRLYGFKRDLWGNLMKRKAYA